MVALCGLAPSLPLLVAARLGSGLATGWIIPLALAFVGDVIPYERRQQVLGRFLSGQILGQLFGQAAGGVLGDQFGWRNVFFILAAPAGGRHARPVLRAVAQSDHACEPRHGAAGPRLRRRLYAVLRSPWARTVIVIAFIESGAMFGAFTYVGADLHLRFGVSFTLVGLFVGTFAIGGLIYSLSRARAVRPLRPEPGLPAGGGSLLALAYVTLAFEPHYWIAPFAIAAIGLGFYMLHNTLQTNATQMTPEARGTAVASSPPRFISDRPRASPRRRGVRPLHRGAAVSSARPSCCWRWVLSFARLLKRRNGSERLAAARDALDLGPHDALDHARQIVVEPGLEHRAQHLLHQVLERARVLPDHGVRQRIERAVHRRDGRCRDQRGDPAARRRRDAAPRCAAPARPADRAAGR